MVGTLKGYDQVINIILSDCEERVYSSKGVEIVHLGLYVIRGDDVYNHHHYHQYNNNFNILPFYFFLLPQRACIGEIDSEIDKDLDFTKIKADPLDPVKH